MNFTQAKNPTKKLFHLEPSLNVQYLFTQLIWWELSFTSIFIKFNKIWPLVIHDYCNYNSSDKRLVYKLTSVRVKSNAGSMLKLTPLMIMTHTPLSIIFFIQDDKAKDTLFSQQISICLLLTEQTAVSNCRLAFVCSLQSKLQFQHFHPGKWRLWMIALDFLGFH